MKRLLIYLSFFVLMAGVAAPALAQTPQEDAGGALDQYNGSVEDPCFGLSGVERDACLEQFYGSEGLTCDNYYQYEVPPLYLVESCEPPENLPCVEYYEYELLLPYVPERCEGGQGGGPDAIPEANKSSNQAFKGLSKTLSEIRSGEQNEAEAEEIEANKSSSQSGSGEPSGSATFAAADDEPVQPSESGGSDEAEAVRPTPKDPDTDQKAGNEQDGAGSESKTGVGDEAEPISGSRDTATGAPDATAPPSVTVLPETSGGSFVLVGAGILLVAGGITAARLFR